jgi:hypothetical protein
MRRFAAAKDWADLPTRSELSLSPISTSHECSQDRHYLALAML